ncbi:MAG: transcriptional repressor [candidate division Zixibacteria bacterium]|nr:transcriptional repressor [candidate division Zixibacteria bacterium]
MSKETDVLDEHLKANNLKKTDQRFGILDIFLRTAGHISAYELHTLIRKQYPNIGFSTVYRTLKLFTECGLANEVNFGDGRARFEKSFRRVNHGHLICSKCGKTKEFTSAAVDKVQKQIVGEHKYKPQGFRFEIYGLCNRCQ